MQDELPAPLASAARRALLRDLAVAAVVTAGVAVLAARFQLSELVFSVTRRWERVQLDEWPIAAFALMLCLAWMTWRRYRHAQHELAARHAAETRLTDALAENRRLAHEHLRAQEGERKHLAHELHDELGQYTNAIKLDAVALGEPQLEHADLVAPSTRIVMAVDHMHAVLNDMIRRLRPAGLDELGLSAALESCVDHWRTRLPRTQLTLRTEGSFDDLGDLARLMLYRLVQEALTNASRHSGADRIDVLLARDEAARGTADEIRVTVADDGRGMDPRVQPRGFGLAGMRERVELMGGTFRIDTRPGEGFRIQAWLPAAGHE